MDPHKLLYSHLYQRKLNLYTETPKEEYRRKFRLRHNTFSNIYRTRSKLALQQYRNKKAQHIQIFRSIYKDILKKKSHLWIKFKDVNRTNWSQDHFQLHTGTCRIRFSICFSSTGVTKCIWLKLATIVMVGGQEAYKVCFSVLPLLSSSVCFKDNKAMFIVHQLSCSPKFQPWNTSHVKEHSFLHTGTSLFPWCPYESPIQSLAIGSDKETLLCLLAFSFFFNHVFYYYYFFCDKLNFYP